MNISGIPAGSDAEIYRLLLSRYSLNADESVFIDDTKENVDAAEALATCLLILLYPTLCDNSI